MTIRQAEYLARKAQQEAAAADHDTRGQDGAEHQDESVPDTDHEVRAQDTAEDAIAEQPVPEDPEAARPEETPAGDAPKRSRKPRQPKAAAKAAAKDPEPQAPDAPLTKDQKHALAAAVVTAAAGVLGNRKVMKDLPAGTAAAQVAAWMAYLPAGGAWDDRLPKPAKR